MDDGMGCSGWGPSLLQLDRRQPRMRRLIPDSICKGIEVTNDGHRCDGASEAVDDVPDGCLSGVQTNEPILHC